MTEDEIKFLEVIYNRGSLAEQAYLNYVHAKLGAQSSDMQLTRDVETIFSRLEHFGLIEGTRKAGLYNITELGKEKFESLNEQHGAPALHNQFFFTSRRPRFHLSRRVWIALAVMLTVFSIFLSSIIAHWDRLIEEVKHLIS